MRTCLRLLVLLFTPISITLAAQGAPARLMLTVSDSTGGVLPAARVTITAAAPDAMPKTVETSPQGAVTVPDLAPGRYAIKAEFEGLETVVLPDVRLRAGDNRQSIVLPLPKMRDSVTVGVDRQAGAADRNRAFGSALTREQIEALSDDKVELQRQLMEMAGVEAIIRVDTFEGADLPPKAQIKSIHITRDAFAAENHVAGGVFIDIVTQPGIGPLRGGFNTRLRDGRLSAMSPFVTRKGPEQLQNYNVNIGGTIRPEVSSFSVNLSTNYAYDTPILRAAVPNGTVSQTLGQRVPQNNFSLSALVDYALTKDQTLRVGVSGSHFTSENLGVGAYDLPGRAFSATSSNVAVRMQETGPIGRRFFINSRLGINNVRNSSRSDLEAMTTIVNDAFTSGGQQRTGGRNVVSVYAASDLDYVRGIHSVRAGIQLSPEWYDSDERLNYLGTYTFESLDAYEVGTPQSYTRRIGDPNISYFYMQGGAYVQDDIRVRRGLTLSPGLRVEGVTHIQQHLGLSPRFGMTWAPFKSGRTTLRASAGIFYDWLPVNGYEQSLRLDGYHEREFNLIDPAYDPDGLTAPSAGTVLPVNRFLLGDDLRFASFKRISTGIDQTVNARIRVSATYAFMRASNRWRGNNLNAPIDGVRPDPAFANVIESVSDGRSQQHTLSGIFSLNLARTSAGATAAPVMMNGVAVSQAPARPAGPRRFDWRRMTVNGSYTFSQFDTNADANIEGIFTTPASGTIAGEWGPSTSEVPHRLNVGINSTAIRNLNANFSLTAFSATPYTVRTGFDDNGDLIFNDRPAGVGRNSARGAPQWSLNSSFTYTIPFGRSTVSLPPGVTVNAPGGGLPPQVSVSQQAASRYRLQLMVNIQNLTNHDNYVAYSGVMTSPFFGAPQSVANPRKFDVGIGVTF